MTENMETVNTRLQVMQRATAQEVAKAADLPLSDTYEALVALESRGMARVQVTNDRVGVGYFREWVAA
jgi:DNA-binding IclR family transcriptional regulator